MPVSKLTITCSAKQDGNGKIKCNTKVDADYYITLDNTEENRDLVHSLIRDKTLLSRIYNMKIGSDDPIKIPCCTSHKSYIEEKLTPLYTNTEEIIQEIDINPIKERRESMEKWKRDFGGYASGTVYPFATNF